MTFAEQVLLFYKNLEIKATLPPGVVTLNPFVDPTAFNYCSQFYKTFYNDENERTLILGINPGRHGGGVTGVPFTDPIKLEKNCNIPNPFVKKPELSADFIYLMIESFGGVQKFYSQFFISAVSPLGFTKDGRNLNYYDIKELQISLRDFIVDCLKKQMSFGVNTKVCYCLGESENYKFFTRLNAELHLFEKVIPLAHPRFIMQYRRKKIATFIEDYISKLSLS